MNSQSMRVDIKKSKYLKLKHLLRTKRKGFLNLVIAFLYKHSKYLACFLIKSVDFVLQMKKTTALCSISQNQFFETCGLIATTRLKNHSLKYDL